MLKNKYGTLWFIMCISFIVYSLMFIYRLSLSQEITIFDKILQFIYSLSAIFVPLGVGTVLGFISLSFQVLDKSILHLLIPTILELVLSIILGILPVILFIVLTYYLSKKIEEYYYNLAYKIIISLSYLFLFTMLVDIVLYHKWISLYNLLTSFGFNVKEFNFLGFPVLPFEI